MRRSKAKIPLLLTIGLLTTASISAQQARVDAIFRGQRVYGSVEYLGSQSQEVLVSLWEGLRAEITFQLRLYRRSRGFFSFLGDRLLIERRVSQVASFDFYENRYKIQREGKTTENYTGEAEFLSSFFFLPEIELGEIDPAVAPVNYYLAARVRIMPVKIITPLNIITLFSSETAISTPWIEAELRFEGR